MHTNKTIYLFYHKIFLLDFSRTWTIQVIWQKNFLWPFDLWKFYCYRNKPLLCDNQMWYQLFECIVFITQGVHFDIWSEIWKKKFSKIFQKNFPPKKFRMPPIRILVDEKRIFTLILSHISKCTHRAIKMTPSKSWYHIWLSHNKGLFL